jgi:flagellar basal-body rod protein FlgG
MLYEQYRLDVIANNLANASSVGYKKDRIGFNASITPDRTRQEEIVLASSPSVNSSSVPTLMLARYSMDLSEGNYRQTASKLDFAIRGSGYFTIETPDGVRYTRNGQFTLNPDGEIVNQSGCKVMGLNGPIVIPSGKEFQVSEQGEISVDGNAIDRFLITDFPPNGQLRKEGKGMLMAEPGAKALPANVQVLQSHLEESNVDVVKEMIFMIEALRSYESYQKTMQSIVETIQNLNDFAKT